MGSLHEPRESQPNDRCMCAVRLNPSLWQISCCDTDVNVAQRSEHAAEL